MDIPKYFDLEELLQSNTALDEKIENLPSWLIIEHLNMLALFLDGIREAWGSSIIVNSGYRSKALNSAIKGSSPTSVHRLGYAADIRPGNGKITEFKKFIVEYLKDKDYDQCIIEKSGNSQWIHIGLFNNAYQQRKQCFKKEVQ